MEPRVGSGPADQGEVAPARCARPSPYGFVQAVGFVRLEPSPGPGPPAPPRACEPLRCQEGALPAPVFGTGLPSEARRTLVQLGAPPPPPHLLPHPFLSSPTGSMESAARSGSGKAAPEPAVGAPISPAQSGAVAEGPCPVLWLLVLVRTAWPGAPPHCSLPPMPPPAHVYPSSSGQGGSGQQDRSVGPRAPAWSGETAPGSLAPALGPPAPPPSPKAGRPCKLERHALRHTLPNEAQHLGSGS